MVGTTSKEKCSEIISHVNRKNEALMAQKYLFACGLRYRKNFKQLSGTLYIVFPKYKCSLTDVSGMVIKDANTLFYRQPISNIGRKRLRII